MGAADAWGARCLGIENKKGTLRPGADADLVVLDLGLPDLDGATVVRELRAWSPAPVLVLSARHSEQEKVRLLDAGADDYGQWLLTARIDATTAVAEPWRSAPRATVREDRNARAGP